MSNQQNQNKPPVDTIRNGPVFVKIWEQHGQNGPYPNVTLGRTFKNQQTGEFGESRSFSRSDIEKLIPILPEVHSKLRVLEQMYKEQQQNQEQAVQQAVQQTPAQAQGQTQVMQQGQQQGLQAQQATVMAHATPVQAANKAPSHDPKM